MNRRVFAAPLLLTATLLCMGQVRADGTQFQTVRAATANDVINEMLAAGRSRQPTIIRLAAGHYLFSRAFNSQYDPSLLPVVATTIQIVASSPATTSFEVLPDAFPYRFFTVIRGGNLSVYKLTLKGGVEECSSSNCAKLGGGAALNAGGELDFHDCVLTSGNTHYPPLADSPLIDAGGSIGPTCSPTDQIGQRRVEGDADHDGASVCDVGAIEFRPPPHH